MSSKTQLELTERLQRHFRTKRMHAFAVAFQLTPKHRVLDVGGTPANWLLLPPEQRPEILLLNLAAHASFALPERMTYLSGDGTALPFGCNAFDLVYSNSVIEHVETWERQCRFAAEVRRVGVAYYVQTPNRWFPIEPHLFFEPRLVPHPLVHYLPRRWQRPPLLPRWYKEIRLLTAAELRRLFPDAEVHRERVGGLTKSFVAMRRHGVAAGRRVPSTAGVSV